MPVRSITLPASSVQPLAVKALLHGIEADLIDRDGDTSYVDLIGSDDKINLALAGFDEVEVIDTLDSVPHYEPVYTMVGRSFV